AVRGDVQPPARAGGSGPRAAAGHGRVPVGVRPGRPPGRLPRRGRPRLNAATDVRPRGRTPVSAATNAKAAGPAEPRPVPLQRRRLMPLLRRLPWAVASSSRQLLHVVLIRYFVALVRYLFFASLLRRLRFYNPSGTAVADNTIAHNFGGMA